MTIYERLFGTPQSTAKMLKHAMLDRYDRYDMCYMMDAMSSEQREKCKNCLFDCDDDVFDVSLMAIGEWLGREVR